MFDWPRPICGSGDLENPHARFTVRARKVMQLANQEAQRLQHEYIGTEHILLGLVKEGSGVAANVFKNLDIDPRKIRLEVEKIVRHGPGGKQVVMGQPHHARARKVIEYSIEEARNLNHNYVGTEHLLLGLLREQEGVAARVLMNLNLKLEGVREEILNLLGDGTPSGAKAPRATPTPEIAAPPPELTTEQLHIIRERVRLLTEEKEALVAAQDFAQAVRLHDEVQALTRLLAWYE